MKLIYAAAEYLFALVMSVIMLVWIPICMLAEIPSLGRYMRIRNM